MLGGRPAMADFGLWGQFYEAATDPTPGAIMRAAVAQGDGMGRSAWSRPRTRARSKPWAALAPTLMPLLKEEVARAVPAVDGRQCGGHRARRQELRDDLGRRVWSQEPQKYHARSLAEIRRKYAAAKAAPGLEAIILAKAAACTCLSDDKAYRSDDAISVAPDRPSSTSTMRRKPASSMRPIEHQADARADQGRRQRDGRPDQEGAVEEARRPPTTTRARTGRSC